MNRTRPDVSARLDIAVEKEQEEIQKHPTSPDWRLCRRNQSWIVADLMIQSGDHPAAAKAATEMAEECTCWQECYDAACLMARCVSLAVHDISLSERDRAKLSRRYARQAVLLLKSAIRKGFQQFERLTQDPDLGPLRSHHDFRSLKSVMSASRARPEASE